MLSPEDQQVQICLLKSNLEEIESSLICQRLEQPDLDADNEKQYRETMTAVRVCRAQNEEIERLKQQNIQLTAKRLQLQRQCEELRAELQEARETRSRLADLIREEKLADERNIRKYQESLKEKTERLRQTRRFYNEEQMKQEFEEVNKTNSEIENEVRRGQQIVGELKTKLETMKPDVPENLTIVLGKMELVEKLKTLTKNREDLQLKMDELKKKQPSMTNI